MFLEKLSDSLAIYNVSLLGYVCMTNHYHLLVTTPERGPEANLDY